jgi:hypothetical protein
LKDCFNVNMWALLVSNSRIPAAVCVVNWYRLLTVQGGVV